MIADWLFLTPEQARKMLGVYSPQYLRSKIKRAALYRPPYRVTKRGGGRLG